MKTQRAIIADDPNAGPAAPFAAAADARPAATPVAAAPKPLPAERVAP